jgi:hypothetical protein
MGRCKEWVAEVAGGAMLESEAFRALKISRSSNGKALQQPATYWTG